MSATITLPPRSLAELEAEAASLRVEISEGEAGWKARREAKRGTVVQPVNNDMPRLRVRLTILELQIARVQQEAALKP